MPMRDLLAGKTVLVAGVGPGLGLATAVLAAAQGAKVHAVARSSKGPEEATSLVKKAGGTAWAHACDLTDAAAVGRMLDAADRASPVTDAIVTAGGWSDGSLVGGKEDAWERMFAVNLTAQRTLLAALAPRIERRGGGSVTLVGSEFGVAFPTTGQIAYNASKGALWAFARSAALELGPKGIRVNCVLPGAMRHDFAPGRAWRTQRSLGAREAPPEDVAFALLLLASDAASWVHGATLVVDGGFQLARGA